MMTDQKIAAGNEINDSISFAALPDDIVVIRVAGRGTFHNSMEMRRLADVMIERPEHDKTHFIVDLEECITMDSTFMGVLASIGLKQLKTTNVKLIVANANSQNVRLLTTLGLSQFITVREIAGEMLNVSDDDFSCMIRENASRSARIIHMIEAHKYLCEADPTNNMRFESVLKYLQDSLNEEKK